MLSDSGYKFSKQVLYRKYPTVERPGMSLMELH